MGRVGMIIQAEIFPEYYDEYREIYKEFRDATLKEPGAVLNEIMLEPLTGNFYIYAIWESQKALEEHLAAEHCVKFSEVTCNMYNKDTAFIKSLVEFL